MTLPVCKICTADSNVATVRTSVRQKLQSDPGFHVHDIQIADTTHTCCASKEIWLWMTKSERPTDLFNHTYLTYINKESVQIHVSKGMSVNYFHTGRIKNRIRKNVLKTIKVKNCHHVVRNIIEITGVSINNSSCHKSCSRFILRFMTINMKENSVSQMVLIIATNLSRITERMFFHTAISIRICRVFAIHRLLIAPLNVCLDWNRNLLNSSTRCGTAQCNVSMNTVIIRQFIVKKYRKIRTSSDSAYHAYRIRSSLNGERRHLGIVSLCSSIHHNVLDDDLPVSSQQLQPRASNFHGFSKLQMK